MQLKRQTRQSGLSLRCYICYQSFPTNEALKIHKLNHAGGTKKNNHSCYICGQTFSFGKLQKHMSLHNQEHYGSSNCKKNSSSLNTSKSKTKPGKMHGKNRPLFSCLYCEKSFLHASTLSKHIKTHTGERPFTCYLCEKSFVDKDGLKVHMRSHTGERPFSCSFCEKAFSTLGNLNIHLTRIHTGERMFSCIVCGKSFATNFQLQTHSVVHNEIRVRFSCSICTKAFLTKGGLVYHLKHYTH